jgi:hypothetical protein
MNKNRGFSTFVIQAKPGVVIHALLNKSTQIVVSLVLFRSLFRQSQLTKQVDLVEDKQREALPDLLLEAQATTID